ncbi:antibiotic biosynthesis monooxygenase [Pseudomonas fulva]|uniref:Antibiotic biosynthesis monooxygenase n=1 Tax=Pseudomonas fulva TaxID=47880 RepID=A0A7S9LJE8_9PSED|nr:putative quinol monooxygenase [Pseudomonas fulva]QPH44620.1 antibiotic biosynthesis monooxygenase [Pseudomonas fulva]QPH49695.1 antibiotic biosynthesis monooxygenase [Pseudomonas fulva]
MSVPVVAVFRAKRGHEEAIEEMFRSVIETTLSEDGCIVYQLNRDIADPSRFVWIEDWTSVELLNRHLSAPHITELFSKLPDLVESSDVFKLTPLAGGKA